MSAIFAIFIVASTILGKQAGSQFSQLNYPELGNFNGIQIEAAKIQSRNATFNERRCFNVTVDVCIPHSQLSAGWQGSVLTTTTPVPTMTTTSFPTFPSTTDLPSTSPSTTSYPSTFPPTTDYPSTTSYPSTFPTTTYYPSTGPSTTNSPSTYPPTSSFPSTISPSTASPSTTTQPIPTTTSNPANPSCIFDRFDCNARTNNICNNQMQCVNTNTGYTISAYRCSTECPSTCPTNSCRQCTIDDSKLCAAPATPCANNFYDCPKRNFYCNDATLTCKNNVTGVTEPASPCSSFCPKSCGSSACRLCSGALKVCKKSTA